MAILVPEAGWASGSPLSIKLFDVAGRVLSTATIRSEGRVSAGVPWNLVKPERRPPRGIFFVRVANASWSSRTTIVLR